MVWDSSVYAIGQQDFKTLREGGALYIDKTAYIKKMADSNSRYYFLARPRRFGKSLFLSTLQYFFEGERDLFKGLQVDSMDWDWAHYPVLRLDYAWRAERGYGMSTGIFRRCTLQVENGEREQLP